MIARAAAVAPAVNPARLLAVKILTSRGAGVESALEAALEASALVTEDRRLLAETVLGTLRMRRRLDWHLDAILGSRGARLAPRLRVILRLAAYQILFLDRVPDYAIVNEAVAIARAEGHDGWAALANAVLRRLCENPAPPRRDSGCDPALELALSHSYPDWIAQRAVAELGRDEAERFLEAGNHAHAVTLRTNLLRTTREALLARLTAGGIAAEACARAPRGVRLAARAFHANLDVLRGGLASVQDESAILVSDLIEPQPGETIADLCAAPGGKTLALAEAAGAGARVIAVDRAARKGRILENLARLGWRHEPRTRRWASADGPNAAHVELVEGDARVLEPIACDAVLVDAPCTGLGVLSRHAELRWEKRDADVARLAAIQGELLDAAAHWVMPGGRLVYSTCSILTDENESVVRAFLERNEAFHADGEPLRTWPHRHGTDGAFAQRMRRSPS
ncbi:MAG: 16S rRNA (cytosine(967)-C(5))-methyltransferase RsmB [bacterium]